MTHGEVRTIAALFVLPDGPYFGVPSIEVWDRAKDARNYQGPFPVVAHPPCERWGRYWHGGPSARVRRIKGDDAGCFVAALESVRRFGGVLEHPADSSAWEAYGLAVPPRSGGWINADFQGGWTCCVYQGHYGHRAQKATWLYAVGCDLPSLRWGKSSQRIRLDDGYHSAEERRRAIKTGVCQRLSGRQRLETPLPFRDVLIGMARSVCPREEVGAGEETAGFVSPQSRQQNTPELTKILNLQSEYAASYLKTKNKLFMLGVSDCVAEELLIREEQGIL